MNKKFHPFLLLLLMLVAGTLFGQKRIGNKTLERSATSIFDQNRLQPRMTLDTIVPPAFLDVCSNTVTNFTINGFWGNVAGMNGYGDLEKTQLMNTSTSGMVSITEAWGFFDIATAVGDGNLRMKIYGVSTSQDGPQELLGQSDDLKTSDLQVDPQQILTTVFPFSSPVTLNDSLFFLSCDLSDLYAAQDTVSLLMTEDGCGSGDDAWELFSDGTTWVPISNASSWGLNANWFVAAVFEFDVASSVNDPFVAQKGLRMSPAMPNPANNWVELPYNLEVAHHVTLEIYTTDGKLLQRITKGNQLAGDYRERLDVGNLADGMYVYGIVTENARLMSKFAIQR